MLKKLSASIVAVTMVFLGAPFTVLGEPDAGSSGVQVIGGTPVAVESFSMNAEQAQAAQASGATWVNGENTLDAQILDSQQAQALEEAQAALAAQEAESLAAQALEEAQAALAAQEVESLAAQALEEAQAQAAQEGDGSWYDDSTGDYYDAESGETYSAETNTSTWDDGSWCNYTTGSWYDASTGSWYNGTTGDWYDAEEGVAYSASTSTYYWNDGSWYNATTGDWYDAVAGITSQEFQSQQAQVVLEEAQQAALAAQVAESLAAQALEQAQALAAQQAHFMTDLNAFFNGLISPRRHLMRPRFPRLRRGRGAMPRLVVNPVNAQAADKIDGLLQASIPQLGIAILNNATAIPTINPPNASGQGGSITFTVAGGYQIQINNVAFNPGQIAAGIFQQPTLPSITATIVVMSPNGTTISTQGVNQNTITNALGGVQAVIQQDIVNTLSNLGNSIQSGIMDILNNLNPPNPNPNPPPE